MHPLGQYLASTARQREHGWIANDERRASFARVDAMPIDRPERGSRVARMTAMVRRRIMRTAGV